MRLGWALVALGALVLGGRPAAGLQGEAERVWPPGELVRGALTAEVGEGGADVEVLVDLRQVAGRRRLPLRVLAFGGVPGAPSATLNGTAGAVRLTEDRAGFWSGEVISEAPLPDSVQLRLTYRVDGALTRRGSEADAVLALPWLMVPWPPADGAPGRVRLRLTFPEPVALESPFPANLSPATTGERRVSAVWEAALPVLPSLTRAEIHAAPVGLVSPLRGASEGLVGPGAPPRIPAPGFVFSGLFLAFGLATAGYVGWMVGRERRE